MKYWINIVSRDHVLVGVEGGFTQANHGSQRNLRLMKRGDLLAFYSPKTKYQNGETLQCFTAIGRIIDDEPFQVEMRDDFHPCQHVLYSTGTTGTILETNLDINISKLKSGPLGGDQQLGAKIAEGEIDFVIFFWDPLQAQPHDPDIKALLRLAVVWNIPMACNRASADLMITSPLMHEVYAREIPDYETYQQRAIQLED